MAPSGPWATSCLRLPWYTQEAFQNRPPVSRCSLFTVQYAVVRGNGWSFLLAGCELGRPWIAFQFKGKLRAPLSWGGPLPWRATRPDPFCRSSGENRATFFSGCCFGSGVPIDGWNPLELPDPWVSFLEGIAFALGLNERVTCFCGSRLGH